MISLILIFVSLLVSSQATTLTEQHDRLNAMISRETPSSATGVADYYRHGIPPPPPPKPMSPPHVEMITTRPREQRLFWMIKKYGREEHGQPPPSPKEAPPTHQVTLGEVLAPGNFGKKGGGMQTPTPTHQVTGGSVAGNYGRDGGDLAPPAPHHAPPTHQVSGGGGAELYLLASAE